jgi:hypothetical protein
MYLLLKLITSIFDIYPLFFTTTLYTYFDIVLLIFVTESYTISIFDISATPSKYTRNPTILPDFSYFIPNPVANVPFEFFVGELKG